jgi:hypothetical protein
VANCDENSVEDISLISKVEAANFVLSLLLLKKCERSPTNELKDSRFNYNGKEEESEK